MSLILTQRNGTKTVLIILWIHIMFETGQIIEPKNDWKYSLYQPNFQFNIPPLYL